MPVPFSVCVLATHSDGEVAPSTIVMARELARHFERVVVSTTDEANASAIAEAVPGVETHVSANDSYDVGLFYKAWSALSEDYRARVRRLGFVNDSNILVSRLDEVFSWASVSGADFWGLTDSVECCYHIQSPFMVFEWRAIPVLEEFFKDCGVASRWRTIRPLSALRQAVIDEFELPLTAHMVQRQMSVSVYTPCVAIGWRDNAAIYRAHVLVALGHPLIKRQSRDAAELAAGSIRGEDPMRAAFGRAKVGALAMCCAARLLFAAP